MGVLAAAIVGMTLTGAAPAIDESKVIDLTYTFGKDTIYWPTAKGFEHEKVSWKKTEAGFFYASANIAAAEHGGTHLDAPIHFAEGKRTAAEVPLTDLMGPAVVIDVRAKATEDRDYRASRADVLAWEKEHGKIPAGAIVILHTGWGERWPDRKRYLGSDVPGDASDLHFPGWSAAAAEVLVAREVDAVGIDTASLDHGPSKDFIVHQILNGADIPGLENVANVDRLPARGAFAVAAPMKIENGSGGPARIFAILP